MTSLFPPDPCAPWFQCATPTALPEFVDAVEPCDSAPGSLHKPPEGELSYVGTRLVGETLYRFYRKAFLPRGASVEFWAQVREDEPEAA